MPQSSKKEVLLLASLGLVFAFVCARAVAIDFTHDEAYSFFNVKQFWYAQFLCNANSHWLNSGAMKIASLLGAESHWQLRWFSVASAGGLFVLAYYFIRPIASGALQFLAFTLLCLNPFVLDYFILARGYVSGMFMECLALYFFFQHKKNPTGKTAFWTLTFGGLAAIANFNFFYFFSVLALLFFYENYIKSGLQFLKNKNFYWHAFIAMGFALLVLRALLFIKRCSNDLLLGTTDLFEGPFASAIDCLLYLNLGEKNPALMVPAALMAILTVAAVFTGLYYWGRHQNKIYGYAALILLLLLTLQIINHLLFGVMYPYYRSALSLFPLIGINLICFGEFAVKKIKALQYVYAAAGMALLFNFARNIQFTHTFDFYHQSESRQCFDLVKNLGAKYVGICHEHFGVFINYYQPSDHYKYPFKGAQLNTYNESKDWVEKELLHEMDYLILYPPYKLSYYKKRAIKFTAVKMYPITKTVVLKVKY